MSELPRMLPPRRPAWTMRYEMFDGYVAQDYEAAFAEFAPGDLAEVFLRPVDGPNAKVGMPLDTMAKDLSVLFSIARRYGAPVDVILAALSQQADGKMLGPLGAFLRLYRAGDRYGDPREDGDPETSAGAYAPHPAGGGDGGALASVNVEQRAPDHGAKAQELYHYVGPLGGHGANPAPWHEILS